MAMVGIEEDNEGGRRLRLDERLINNEGCHSIGAAWKKGCVKYMASVQL